MNTAQLAEHQEFASLQNDGTWLVELDVHCSWTGGRWEVDDACFRKDGDSFGDPGVYEFEGGDEDVGHTVFESFRREAESLLVAGQIYEVHVRFLDGGTLLSFTRGKFRHDPTIAVDS
ncbi:MAG: hypothetical protein ACLGHC_09710 [Alphaproteobacteria bacterium]